MVEGGEEVLLKEAIMRNIRKELRRDLCIEAPHTYPARFAVKDLLTAMMGYHRSIMLFRTPVVGESLFPRRWR